MSFQIKLVGIGCGLCFNMRQVDGVETVAKTPVKAAPILHQDLMVFLELRVEWSNVEGIAPSW